MYVVPFRLKSAWLGYGILNVSSFVGAIVRMKRCIVSLQPTVFNADHPYLFVLMKDKQQLFMGRYSDMGNRPELRHEEL